MDCKIVATWSVASIVRRQDTKGKREDGKNKMLNKQKNPLSDSHEIEKGKREKIKMVLPKTQRQTILEMSPHSLATHVPIE